MTLDALEAITTARAIRRLRPDPVPLPLLASLVEAATMAPTPQGEEGWRFLVVTDRSTLAELGRLHAEVFATVRRHLERTLEPKLFASVAVLGEHLGDVPALILVGGTGAPTEAAPVGEFRSWYAGLLPAAQNLLVAARAHGLGATLTTLLLAGAEPAVKELLGVPDDVSFAAAVPVGWPIGRHGKPRRKPVAEVAYLDRWGEAFRT